MIRTALICALVVVEIDVAHAYLTLFFPWPTLWMPLVFVPLLTYVVIGFMLARYRIEPGTAIRALVTAAFADIAVGTPLGMIIERGALPSIALRDVLSAVVVTIAVNAAVGAGGFALGSIRRGTPA